MSDLDHEQLAALETERAYLVENGKIDRASQVDDQIDAVRARIAAAGGVVETTQAPPPAETTDPPKPRRGRPPKPKLAAAADANE